MRPEDIFKIEDSIEIPENNETQTEVSEQKSSEVENFDFKPYLKKEITLEDVMEILKKNNLELDEKTINEYREQIVFQQQEINNITENLQQIIKEKETVLNDLKETPQNSQLLKKLSELENKIIDLSTSERIKEDDIKTTIKNVSNIFEENVQLENLSQNEITETNTNIINFKNDLLYKVNENYENKTFTETNKETNNKVEEIKTSKEENNKYKESTVLEDVSNELLSNEESLQIDNDKIENALNVETDKIVLDNTVNSESENVSIEASPNLESGNDISENVVNLESGNEVIDDSVSLESQNKTAEIATNVESENLYEEISETSENENSIDDSQMPVTDENRINDNLYTDQSENFIEESVAGQEGYNTEFENFEAVQDSYDYSAENLLSNENEEMEYNDTGEYNTIMQTTQKTNEMLQSLSSLIREGFNSLSIALETMPNMAQSSESESSYSSEPSELSSDFEDNPQIFQQNLLSDYRNSLRSNAGLETYMGYSTELKADNLGSYL